MREASTKRFKLSGHQFNSFLIVEQEKELKMTMVIPCLQEVANHFEVSSANEPKSLKQELLRSKQSQANTAKQHLV